VEDCLVLSIHDLIRQGAVVPGSLHHSLWSWTNDAAEEPHAIARYEGDLRNESAAWLQLQCITEDGSVNQSLWLTHTHPHFGGLRWWFWCPVMNVRAGKLYLPPGARLFASRRAYGLTYESCQRSGASERFWQQLVRDTEGTREVLAKVL
jgi:hypothetical protein